MEPFISARQRRRIVSASNSLSRSSLCQRGVMPFFGPRWCGCDRVVIFNATSVPVRAGHWPARRTIKFHENPPPSPYGPDTRPARVSFTTGFSLYVVGAASPGGPYGVDYSQEVNRGGPAGCPARTGALQEMHREFGGPPGEAAPTASNERIPRNSNAGRPGVRPVRGTCGRSPGFST